MANLPAPAITATSDTIPSEWLRTLGIWLASILPKDASLEWFIHQVNKSWHLPTIGRKMEFTLSAEDATAVIGVISPTGGRTVYTEPQVFTLYRLARMAETTLRSRRHDSIVRRANAGQWLSQDEIEYAIDLGPWGCV
jgi:hypothetical protein